ncbi:MAG: super-infection exclusion protein B [Fluviicola sp.]
MENWIDRIFSLKTLPGKLIFVLWFSSCVLVFLPEKFLGRLSLLEFKSVLGLYIGPTALISTAILLWMVARFFNDRIVTNKLIKKRKSEIEEHIRTLTFHEVALLREFYIQGKDTISIPYSDETVIALQNKGIICVAANSAFVGIDMGYPFSMTNYARGIITPRILRLPQSDAEVTQQIRHKLWQERPGWAKEMERRKQLFSSIW